jgi:hypothetical protein
MATMNTTRKRTLTMPNHKNASRAEESTPPSVCPADIDGRRQTAVSAWGTWLRAALFVSILLGLNAGPLHAVDLGNYHTYASMVSSLQEFASTYPAITQLYSIGKSEQGRDIWCLRITDNPQVHEAEPSLAYLSTFHGNEPVGAEMSLYFINQLLSNYGTNSRISQLVNNVDISIVPLLNPDGFVAGTRENAHGYDLNRSFPEGSPPNNFGNVLDGPSMSLAGRPAEVRNTMQWMAANRFTLSANFHTGALVVNYPYDNDGHGSVNSPCPDDALFKQISETYSSHNAPMWNSPYFPHGITNGAAWYAVSGGLQDWTYRYLGENAVTIELSDTFKPPQSQLPTLWSQNQESMLSFAETCEMGVHGLMLDSVTGLPVNGAVQITGQDRRAYSDPGQGFFDYMLLPGTYDLTFTAPGYAPMFVEDVTVPAGAGIDLDIALLRVPEPSSLAMLAAGAFALVILVQSKWGR